MTTALNSHYYLAQPVEGESSRHRTPWSACTKLNSLRVEGDVYWVAGPADEPKRIIHVDAMGFIEEVSR